MDATNPLASIAQLSNPELLAKVKRLAERERGMTAALVAHLAELDARRYPIVLERLAEGAVTLTTVGLLAAHLTPENHRELLDRARHQSKRQVEELVARLRPQPPVPPSVRKLPTPSLLLVPPAVQADRARSEPVAHGGITSDAPPVPAMRPPPARPAVVAPLAPARYKVQFTASADTYARLRLAQDLLRHQIPDGDLGQVFDGYEAERYFGAEGPWGVRQRARRTADASGPDHPVSIATLEQEGMESCRTLMARLPASNPAGSDGGSDA